MKVIGLTGAPGCGKSTALAIFARLGWKIIDADALCRMIHGPGHDDFHRKLLERWGEKTILPDGSTNRSEVAAIVFNDHAELEWLEGLIQPEAEREADRMISALPQDACVMFEVPLLFEKKWNLKTDAVIAIWTSPEKQMERLLARGWSYEHARSRMALQFPADKKLEMADFGLINTGTVDELEEQCRVLDNILR